MATKAQEQRVQKWVSRWKSKLLLDNWAIVIEYPDEPCSADTSSSTTCANIRMDPRYREAHLSVFPHFFTKPVGFQRATILHEVIHIVTDPVRRALNDAAGKHAISSKRADDVSEGVTEDIAKIVLKSGKPTKDNYRL